MRCGVLLAVELEAEVGEWAGRGLGAEGEYVCGLKRLLIFAFCVDGWRLCVMGKW